MTTRTLTSGIASVCGPAAEPWLTLLVTGEPPIDLTSSTADLFRIGMSLDQGGSADAGTVEFASLDVHDEVIFTYDGTNVDTATALDVIAGAIVAAMRDAIVRTP